MLLVADWVLPISDPPIRHGAVAVREGVIVEVGPAADLAARWIDERVEAFDDCILAPGLVNAHTHLALSVLEGLLGPGPLHPWLKPVTRAVLGLSHEEFGVSSALGALESLRFGTTAVGDISYGSETPTACHDRGLAGVFFWEVLGLHPREIEESLARRGYPNTAQPRGRIRAGLSPHAPYSSGPELLRETRRRARETGVPFAIHVAESPGEVELMRTGSGPFVAQVERLAHGFETPDTTPVRYLDALGVLEDAICVHAVHVDADDIELLAERARGVVLCPRSNAYLENGVPPVRALREAGVRLALGTDSSASNTDLDLFAEASAARELASDMPADELVRMLTLSGARMLGLDDDFGTLAEGTQADLVIVRADRGRADGALSDAEAYELFLESGADGRVEGVMTAGDWRIRDCAAVGDLAELAEQGRRVKEHARELVADGDQSSARPG